MFFGLFVDRMKLEASFQVFVSNFNFSYETRGFRIG